VLGGRARAERSGERTANCAWFRREFAGQVSIETFGAHADGVELPTAKGVAVPLGGRHRRAHTDHEEGSSTMKNRIRKIRRLTRHGCWG
jgi:hypothetical protein